MQDDILEKIKQKALPILIKADVKKAAVFGSYVRGDHSRKSDIDILIDLPRGKTILDFIGIKLDLEDSLQKKVDLVTYNGINKYLRKSILEQQYPIL